MTATIPATGPNQITGVVLAGGQGSRMGGIDKGLQPFHGEPLALHVLRRLAPQCGALLISANRSIERYMQMGEPFGARVIADTLLDDVQAYPGPLAGIASAMHAASTEFMLIAPCDAPFTDPRLAVNLARALDETHADIAVASVVDTTGQRHVHPVFALLRRSLVDDLDARLIAGDRKVRAWYGRHKTVDVSFDNDRAFYNINDLQQLADLERR